MCSAFAIWRPSTASSSACMPSSRWKTNGRLRDECLNEHWFPTLLHARTEIERWRREYNEDRPKKAMGRMTPAAYAHIWQTPISSTPDSKPGRYSGRGDVG